jgi:hypothetical protein
MDVFDYYVANWMTEYSEQSLKLLKGRLPADIVKLIVAKVCPDIYWLSV